MSIPLASYPPHSIRVSIPPPDWAAVIESWNTALTLLLQLPSSKFAPASTAGNLTAFLKTYLTFTPLSPPDSLRKKVFLVIHRTLTASPLPLLTTAGFLEGFGRVYVKVPAAQRLLSELWSTHETELERAVRSLKTTHIPVFSAVVMTYDDATSLSRLFQLSPKAAAVFLAGDEFADAAADGQDVVVKLFARAMTEAAKTNWSVVVDGLYSLTAPSAGKKEKALAVRLGALGVGARLKSIAGGTEYAARVEGAVQKLHALAPPVQRKVMGNYGKKDKGKAVVTPSDEREAEMASMVNQIRDLFPDLGSGFVRRCLIAMGGDVEAVTGALLEEKLPADLAVADQTEEFIPPDTTFARPSPSPALLDRKSIFDNDALSTLSPSALRSLTVGKRANAATADSLLSAPAVPKSAILSALAAFDSDSDERDDTYDIADVGGAVDHLDEEPDEELGVWTVYQRSPGDFARGARGGVARKTLKESTGWTDEALEGWAVMLAREPERRRRLERRFADVEVPRVQLQLERTSWRAGDGETERGRGRGRGRGGMGRGGPSGGPSGSAGPSGGEARGRARKEQNKGRVANHSRREGRAKKMARGFAGAPM